MPLIGGRDLAEVDSVQRIIGLIGRPWGEREDKFLLRLARTSVEEVNCIAVRFDNEIRAVHSDGNPRRVDVPDILDGPLDLDLVSGLHLLWQRVGCLN